MQVCIQLRKNKNFPQHLRPNFYLTIYSEILVAAVHVQYTEAANVIEHINLEVHNNFQEYSRRQFYSGDNPPVVQNCTYCTLCDL